MKLNSNDQHRPHSEDSDNIDAFLKTTRACMATKTRDVTLSAAAPSLASGARQNGAETVSATVKRSRKGWWRCFVRCLCCFSGSRRRRAVKKTPSPLLSSPTTTFHAVQESSPFPCLPFLKSPAVEEDFSLLSAPLPPSPKPEKLFPLPPTPSTVPIPDTTTKSTVTPTPNPTPAPTHTLTPTPAPAVTSTPSPTPACAEEDEATEDVLDLVRLRRGQELPYNRVVYVEGEDATDGERWTESRSRRAKGRRPLPQEPLDPAPTAANTTEAAAASRGRRAWRRQLLQQEPRDTAQATATSKAAAAAVATRQPRGRQRTAPGPVWASWQEPEVECLLPVPPHLRRCIVGRGGANLRNLRQQFPAVRVRVPPPQDTTSRSVAVEGPRSQVHAALACLKTRLQ